MPVSTRDILAHLPERRDMFSRHANAGVNYLNPPKRGLEAGDSVTISGQRQILFDTTASSPGDYVRVLTAFSPGASTGVPEPGIVGLLGNGLVAVTAILGWKRVRPRAEKSVEFKRLIAR